MNDVVIMNVDVCDVVSKLKVMLLHQKKIVLVTSLILSLTLPIYAQLPDFGGRIIVSNDNTVVATYEGNTSAFTHLLYWSIDEFGEPGLDGNFENDLLMFNNQESMIGDSIELGSFEVGTELTFRLFVLQVGANIFNTSEIRSIVEPEWMPNTTLVRFEDFSDADFDDMQFSITNTTAKPLIILGDINLDCQVNILDVAPFVTLMSKGVFQLEADINEDGFVDLLDVAPFVDLLAGS